MTSGKNLINRIHLEAFRWFPASAINKYVELRRKHQPDAWLNSNVYFIHIPKTAGSSVSKSMQMPDPGHLLFEEMSKETAARLSQKPCFMIIRDPLDRLISTYNYAVDAYNLRKRHPLSFIGKYKNGTEFIDAVIHDEKFQKLYFTRPAFLYYESARSLGCQVDVIRYEEIRVQVPEYLMHHGINCGQLPHVKVSRNRTLQREQICPKAVEKIQEIFKNDELLRRSAVKNNC